MTILASVVLVLGIGFGGNVINGSSGWVSLGGIVTVNVRILIFLMIPLYAAVLYQYRGQGYGSIGKGLLWTFAYFRQLPAEILPGSVDDAFVSFDFGLRSEQGMVPD